MNSSSYSYEEPESEVNLIDILWDLLAQWKAIVLVALAVAIALPTIKLLLETKSYEATLQKHQQEQTQAKSLSADEVTDAIGEVLTSLAAREASAIELLAQQQALINTQSSYLDTSLLMNLNAANEHILYVKYRLEADGDVQITPLADAYATLFRNDGYLQQLQKVINPDADIRYIYELILVSNSPIPDSSAKSVNLSVSVALPADVNVQAVGDTVDSIVASIHATLGSSMGRHAIKPLNQYETYTYNAEVVNRKATIVTNINATATAMRTNIASLSPRQKAAIASIAQTLNANDESAQTEQAAAYDALNKSVNGDTATNANGNAGQDMELSVPAPTFSKKLAAIGFVLGIVLYAIVYLVYVVLRGRIESGETLADYTGVRLVGDVYFAQKHKGVSKLFHSVWICKHRYASKGTVTSQVERAVSTIESVCAHADATSIHLLRMSGSDGAAAAISNDMVSALSEKGIDAQIVDVDAAMDEKELLSVKHAIYYANDEVKASDVWQLCCLCRSYDVAQLGNVFVKAY